MPFVHANIRTDGNIHLCCASLEKSNHNIKNSSISEWWSGLDQIRQDMLEGVPNSACQICYEKERNGLSSERLSNNKKFKIVSEKYAKKIVDLYYKDLESPIDYELQITNICNLKCIMCSEPESSSLLTENKILKISNFDSKEYLWDQKEIDKVLQLFQNQNTRSITLRGGEPFLIPQIKQAITESIKLNCAKNIDLEIVTNCTVFDDSWIEILNKFKSVTLICSIDAVGDRYEYIRYGAKWSEVDKNIQLMKQIKNVKLSINSVVQNLNLMGINELINWAQTNDLYIVLTKLQYPECLSIDVLPSQIKQNAIDKLKKISYNKVENLKELIEILNVPVELNTVLWEEFKSMILLKDNHRKVSIVNSAPEFKTYF